MGGRAGLILQGHVYGEVRVESDEFQERIGKIVKRVCFKF
jgi:hypothetical protein